MLAILCLLGLTLTAAADSCTLGRVCQLGKSSLNMLVLGDWGGQTDYPYTTIVQQNVARAADKTGQAVGSDAVLAIGDNFYHDGVTDEYDTRFKTTWLDVYSDKAGLQTPWYVLAGNHDHYGNVSGQIAYSSHNELWTFPNYYYTIRYALSDGTRVDIVMIDTVLLLGKSLIYPDEDETAPPVRRRPMTAEEVLTAETQWAWIEAELAASTAEYLLVVGHYPVWSASSHGPTKLLVDRLLPLLRKYSAQMYVCGHDHDLQHILADDGIHHVVSGSADKLSTSEHHIDSIPKDSLKYRWPQHHSQEYGLGAGGFAHIVLTPAAATVRYYLASGQSEHQFSFAPRK